MAAGLAWASPDGSRFGEDQAWWQQVWLGQALVAAGFAKTILGGSRAR